MEPVRLECLQCGDVREARSGTHRVLTAGECGRCGYLGWARTTELSELARRGLRDRPPAARRLRSVA